MHEAVREAFIQRLIVGALERQKDSTAKNIMADMVKDYEDTLDNEGTTFSQAESVECSPSSSNTFIPACLESRHLIMRS